MTNERSVAESPRGVASEALLKSLEGRRSIGMTQLGEPGPDPEELRRILAIAARVPDHGMLEPWRLIVIEGHARHEAGERLSAIYQDENGAMAPAQRDKFAAIMARALTHAPTIVVVVSRTDPQARVPAWEQDLSAGAVCMDLLNATHALGFGANWLTGWAAYSVGARALLGVSDGEKVAGIIHIGTAKERPADRKRPNVEAITSYWSAGTQRRESYGTPGA